MQPGLKAEIKIKEIGKKDRKWMSGFFLKHWKSEKIVSRGKIYHSQKLPGFVAISGGRYAGITTYYVKNRQCEIITLNSIVRKKGIGTALIKRLKKEAKKLNCKRLWLTVTNDNVDAMRFYQKRGFYMKAVYPNAITFARNKLKPEIPMIGEYGILMRDEIEMEIPLG